MPALRPPRPRDLWLGGLVFIAGAALVVRLDISWRRDAFQAEARTAHRVLSQATARLDAVLGTLVLVAKTENGSGAEDDATGRLPALYPQVLAAWRQPASEPPGGPPGPHGGAAGAAMLTTVEGERGVYTLQLDGRPAGFALRVDARRLAAPEEWPWAADAPVRVTLAYRGQVIVLQDATDLPSRPFGLTEGFEFTKTLSSPSQPFQMRAQRFAGPAQWPWALLAGWALLCAALGVAARRWRAARAERRRAAELARLAQAARLNTLGELAAGIAHELNQPLTATLAGTQAALRLLRDPEPAGGAEHMQGAVQALELASAQARRAADVVARLRRLLQPGSSPAQPVATDLARIARHLATLLAPELEQHAIALRVEGDAPAAQADPVAVEQILHNLLANAMQALQSHQPRQSPKGPGAASIAGRGGQDARRITVRLSATAGAQASPTVHAQGAGSAQTGNAGTGPGARVHCSVRDNGPGVPPEAAARLFEPFFTTRAGGLGLGLPLCQTLALAMDGQVRWQAPPEGGAEFVLDLPAAPGEGRPAPAEARGRDAASTGS